ncbi:MAG: HYR domain-containing protein [Bacteroidales bacterium]|nr:HYR domain-containing protein [Bacteroidales bacterium]
MARLTFAADYFWVGGSGDWSDHSHHWATTSGGLVFHPSVPSQFDNVIFDANSFSAAGQTVTVNYESFCNQFDSRDVISGAKFTSTKTLNVYGGLEIDQNMTYYHTGNLNIFSGGITLGTAAGIPVSFSVYGTIVIESGGITTGRNVTFVHPWSYVLQVKNGDVLIGNKNTTTMSQLTISTGKLTVGDSATFTGYRVYVYGGQMNVGNHTNYTNYHTLYISTSNLVIGDYTNFRTYYESTQLFAGDLVVGENSLFYSYSDCYIRNGNVNIGANSTFQKDGYTDQIWNGNFILGANATFKNSGGVYVYNGTLIWDNTNLIQNYNYLRVNSGDFTFNSSTQFNPVGNLYTGNGSMTIESGATVTVSRFETANGSLTVEAGATATINSEVYLTNGTIDLDPAANLNWWANLYLRGNQYGQYDIKTGGRDIKRIQFDGSNYNSEYTFLDDVKASSDGIFLYANKIFFNGKGVDVYHFYSWTGGEVWMDLTGTDTVYVRSQFRMYPSSNTHLTLGDAVIKWHGTDHHYLYGGYNNTYNDLYFKEQNTGGSQIYFEGNTVTVRDINIDAYGTQYTLLNNNFTVRNFTMKYKNNYTATPYINFSGNWNVTDSFYVESPSNMRMNLNSYANNTFGTFHVTNLNQWILRSNTTQTFDALRPIAGTCDKTIPIKGETYGSQGTFSLTSGTFSGDWLVMQDVKGTGGGSLIANNTVDLGNVTGWTVNSIAPRDFYWVGNNGNWNVPGNWSETSGGTPGVCGVPNRTDNAIFDANSFSASGQFVNINVSAEVNNMTWDNVTSGAGITGGNDMNIYGSLQLASGMNFNHYGTFYFQAIDLGNTVKTNGVQMRQTIFRGQNLSTGEWILLDDFNAHNNYLYFERGTFRTNGHNVDVHSFYNWTGQPANIHFSQSDTSFVKVQYEFRIYPTTNVNVFADSTDIIWENNNNHMYFYSGDYDAQYRDLIFNSQANAGYYIHMQYPNKARDIKVTCSGNQYMYFYDQKQARNVSINYLNGSPSGQWIQMNGSNTFNSLSVQGIGNNRPTVYLHGTNTIGHLDIDNVSGLYFGGWQYLTSADAISGTCDRLLSFWGGTGVNMASGLFEVNWATMTNVQATGGATFNANNILGTSYNIPGWNVNNIPPTNFYWVGGTGNWNDPNHWSYTSGGTPGVCPLPTRFDNVFFDVNSFTAPNQIVYANTTIQVKNMIWNNVNYPRFYGGNQVEIYGSLKLDEKLSQEESGWWYFRSKTAGNTIDPAGKKFWYVRFDGEGYSTGEWKLQGDLDAYYDIYVDRGTFISDSNNISARMFYCWTGSPTTVDLTGTDWVKVEHQFRIYPNNFNLIMDKADVIFTGTNQFYFIGGNNTFNDVEMTATSTGNTYIEFNYNNVIDNVRITANGYQTIRFYGNSTYNDVDVQFNNPSTNIPNVYFHGTNTINDLSITSIGNAGPYIWLYANNTFNNLVSAGLGTRLYPAGNTTQTVNDVLALGSGGFPVFFQSQTQGTLATIYKPTGTVCLDYVWMRDIKAASNLNPNGSMKTSFFAGNNSVNMGNNPNWAFSSCDGYYWVGGSGKWSETGHWATASGGTQLHSTLPTQFDNVFFDANSFTTSGEIVEVDLADPRCNNMSWSSSLFTPTVVGSGDMNIYGSLKFVSNMNMDFTGSFNFKSDTTGNEINSGGHTLANVNFIGGNDGEGAWTLSNNLTVSNDLSLSNGSFSTNGKEVETKNFNSTTINTRDLNLGSSKITINDGQWNPSGTTNLTFDAGTSSITVTGTSSSNFFGQGFSYHNVTFNTPGQLASAITGENTYDLLKFSAGITATMDPGVQEATIIQALGTCDRNVTLLSSVPGTAATLKQTSGSVVGKFLTLQDNEATGGASFNANLSNDLGNVSGWSFTSAPVISVIEETGLVDCVLNNDGWAKVTVIQGTAPFTYLWSTTETTDSIGGLIPGTYYVTVTDSAGCSITEAIDVLNRPSVLDPIVFTMSDDQICLGTPIDFAGGDVISNALAFDGSDDNVLVGNFATLSPTATQPVTFEAWVNPASNANGMIASKYFNGDATQSNFFVGLNNGQVQVSGNGTDVLFSSATIPTSDWTHIAVVLEEGSGNTIIYVNGAYDNSGTLTYNTSNGNADFALGTIAAGTLPSHYFSGILDEVRVWDTVRSLSDINQNLTVPQAGTEAGLALYYRLDELAGSTVAVDRSTNGLNGTLSNMDATTAWVSPGAFTPTISYTWDFGDFQTATGQTASHTYTGYGTYIVSLSTKDATGCPNIVKDTVVVSQITTTVASTNVKCYGANNGSITVTASGGVQPYNYSINGGTTFFPTGTFTNLIPGSYTVFVTDAIACESAMQQVNITQPASELQFTASVDNVVCPDDEDGKITISASGGTAPYQYSKNAGISYQASNVFADLLPGNYTIRVRDASNCTPADQVITVEQNDNIAPEITCPANITVNATNMVDCFVEVIYPEPVATDNCQLPTVELTSGLASGSLFPVGETTVTYTATDGNNNATSCSFTVTVVDATPPVAVCQNIDIYLDEAGNVTLSPDQVDGGSYDNCDSTALGVDLSEFNCSNLGPNTVVLTVTDQYGNSSTCTTTVSVVDTIAPVTACNDIVINLPDRNSYFLTQLEIDQIAFGSTDNCSFTYELTSGTTVYDCNSAGNSYPVSLTFTDPSGNISVCTANVFITDTNSVCNDPPVAICQNYLVSAGENCDAMISVANIDGGSYDPDGDPLTMTLNNYGPFGVGTHTVILTVSDYEYSSICSATVTVVDDTPPTANCQDIIVELDPTGNVTITSAQIDNGSFDACGILSLTVEPSSFNCTNVGDNTVTLTVVDNNSNVSTCSATVTVQDNEAPTMTCITEPQFRNPNFAGCGYVEMSGEFTPTALMDNCSNLVLSYELTGATTGTGSSLSGISFELGITTVTWTLTDESLNQVTCSFEVTVENNLETTVSSPEFAGGFNIRCNGGNDGSVDLTVTGGTEPYSYVWSNGATTEDLTDLTAGTYEVIVTDVYGCTIDATITLTEPTVLVADAGSDLPICYTFETTIGGLPSASGGVGPYTYSWSPTTGLNDPTSPNPIAGPLTTTTYTITVTDQNGCVDVSSMVLTVNPLPEASIEASTPDEFCNGVTLTAYSSTTEWEYAWSRGDLTQSIFLNSGVDPDGLYSVYVTDQNGCTSPIPAYYTFASQNLTSSYTILGLKEVKLGEQNIVQNGSVGVTGKNRKAEIKKGAVINSPGSFVKADKIYAHRTAVILKKIYDPVTTTLPTMYYNTTSGISGKIKVKKNTTTTISTEYVDIEIGENCHVTITGSVYGEIEVDKGSTVIFTSSSIDIEELKTDDSKVYKPTSIEFAYHAQVRVKDKVEIGKNNFVNPYNSNVIFYIGTKYNHGGHGDKDDDDDDDDFSGNGNGNDNWTYADDNWNDENLDHNSGGGNGGDKGDNKGSLTVKAEGTSFNASAYVPRGKIHVKENAAVNNPGTMTGQFIAEKVYSTGKYITWNWHDCNSNQNVNPITPPTGGSIAEDATVYNVFPVPNNGLFTTTIDAPFEDDYSISVYNTLGVLLFEKREVHVDGYTETQVDIQHVPTGIYYVIFRNADHQEVKKILINK